MIVTKSSQFSGYQVCRLLRKVMRHLIFGWLPEPQPPTNLRHLVLIGRALHLVRFKFWEHALRLNGFSGNWKSRKGFLH